MKKFVLSIIMMFMCAFASYSQMSTGCNKFLGNITTSYNWQEYCDLQDCDGYVYSNYWNQVTCENATKWGSVNTSNGVFNWSNADRTYNYCKQKGILFKFHALMWGSQYPSWIESLSVADTKKAIVAWFDEVKKHYPDLQIIDVVNEAIYSGTDYHSPYKKTKIIQALTELANERLGTNYQPNTNGYSKDSDYQWIAECFRMARERWPQAILIYNDYNTFRWQKNEFISLLNGLKACGAPIDAAGNQSHDLNDMSGSDFKTALYDIYNRTKLPQYITEYDIAHSNDATFETRYREQFPVMWEADFVPGVTLWGWEYGKTWTTDGNSGLVKNCQKRSAFTFLESYMKTDAAKNAKSPDMSKGPSVSVDVDNTVIELGDVVTLTAKMTNSTKIEWFIGNGKIGEGDRLSFEPETPGVIEITVVGTNKDNKTAKTDVTIKVVNVGPYKGIPTTLPGKLECENYDEGLNGKSYYDSDEGNVCDEYTNYYRSDDVDIKSIKNGVAVGHCVKGEYMTYTVDIEKSGTYNVTANVGCGNTDGGNFLLSIGETKVVIDVNKTGDWGTFSEVSVGKLKLEEGLALITISIGKDWIDLDWIDFDYNPTGVDNIISDIEDPEYYSLTGVKVKDVSNLKGVYIEKRGNRYNKMIK